MNLDIATLPLPSMSSMPTAHRRRSRKGGLALNARSLHRFHRVAESLQPAVPPPAADAIAAAADDLRQRFAHVRRAPCIRLRLRCLTALRTMAQDMDWALDDEARERIARILVYAADPERLVPDAIPVVGGLDDAVLVELAWPALRCELDDYLDFRRLRAEEAAWRDVHPRTLRFDRGQWLQARAAEQALIAHVRRRGLTRYAAPVAPALFAIR
jgi:uncharacterized membrane protein YkvA (DUF1232 family)